MNVTPYNSLALPLDLSLTLKSEDPKFLKFLELTSENERMLIERKTLQNRYKELCIKNKLSESKTTERAFRKTEDHSYSDGMDPLLEENEALLLEIEELRCWVADLEIAQPKIRDLNSFIRSLIETSNRLFEDINKVYENTLEAKNPTEVSLQDENGQIRRFVKTSPEQQLECLVVNTLEIIPQLEGRLFTLNKTKKELLLRKEWMEGSSRFDELINVIKNCCIHMEKLSEVQTHLKEKLWTTERSISPVTHLLADLIKEQAPACNWPTTESTDTPPESLEA